MTLKPIKGTFDRAMIEDGKVVMQSIEARIYAEHFAVYELVGGYGDSWHLDYVPSGESIKRARTLKDCVAKIESLLELSIPWGVSKGDIADYVNAHSEIHSRLHYALARTAGMPLSLEQQSRDNARLPDSPPKGMRIDR